MIFAVLSAQNSDFRQFSKQRSITFTIMKSIIKTKTEKMLLTVNIVSEDIKKLEGIMKDHSVKLISAQSDDGNEQLGFLLGFGGFRKTEKEKLTVLQSCAVFSGIEGTELSAILKEMRSAGVIIDLKAVCTAYNQRWTLAELACELEKEHNAMTGGGRGE